MAVDNVFRVIGTCYGNPRRRLVGMETYRTYFTIVTNGINGEKRSFIPVVAAKDQAEKASVLCRNGNMVCVTGVIFTTEINNDRTGLVDIRVHFIATDIMIIKKAVRTELNDKTVATVISSMPIDHEERKENELQQLLQSKVDTREQ